jgi:hypothetical protein
MRFNIVFPAALALAALAASATAVIGGPGVGPCACGEYKYWHNRRCMDARDKKSTETWQQMILAEEWKA